MGLLHNHEQDYDKEWQTDYEDVCARYDAMPDSNPPDGEWPPRDWGLTGPGGLKPVRVPPDGGLRERIAECEKERDEWKAIASTNLGLKLDEASAHTLTIMRAETAEASLIDSDARNEQNIEIVRQALDRSAKAEASLARIREALKCAIDGEHPEGINKHKCVTITCEGKPREPTRPEEFEFCEGVTSMAYEVHSILSAIFDKG
jgi:hypothetical protein